MINRTKSALVCRTWIIGETGEPILAYPTFFQIDPYSTNETRVPVWPKDFSSFERAIAEVAGRRRALHRRSRGTRASNLGRSTLRLRPDASRPVSWRCSPASHYAAPFRGSRHLQLHRKHCRVRRWRRNIMSADPVHFRMSLPRPTDAA